MLQRSLEKSITKQDRDKLVDCLVDTSAVRAGVVRERHVGAAVYPEAVRTGSVAVVPDEPGGLAVASGGDVIDRIVRRRRLLLLVSAVHRLTLVAGAEEIGCGRMLLVVVLEVARAVVRASGGVVSVGVVAVSLEAVGGLFGARVALAGNGGHN